jgi:hypothetical protein
VSQAFWKHGVLAGCLALFVGALVPSCGDDDGDGPQGETCPQAGALDDGCICSSDRPAGIRRCLDSRVWGECMCGEPFDQPCEPGDPVECTCPGESTPRTTECLIGGTFDCDCESGGASGNGE